MIVVGLDKEGTDIEWQMDAIEAETEILSCGQQLEEETILWI